MRYPLIATVCAVALALAAGCATAPGNTGKPSETGKGPVNELVGTTWELTLVNMPGDQRLPVDRPEDYRLVFAEETRLVVTADGNQCVGLYNSAGRALSVRLDCPLASGFPPGSVGKEFLAILSAATRFGMTGSGDEMYIDATAGRASLNFLRVR